MRTLTETTRDTSKPKATRINLETSEYPGINVSRTLFGRLVRFIGGVILLQVAEFDKQRLFRRGMCSLFKLSSG